MVCTPLSPSRLIQTLAQPPSQAGHQPMAFGPDSRSRHARHSESGSASSPHSSSSIGNLACGVRTGRGQRRARWRCEGRGRGARLVGLSADHRLCDAVARARDAREASEVGAHPGCDYAERVVRQAREARAPALGRAPDGRAERVVAARAERARLVGCSLGGRVGSHRRRRGGVRWR